MHIGEAAKPNIHVLLTRKNAVSTEHKIHVAYHGYSYRVQVLPTVSPTLACWAGEAACLVASLRGLDQSTAGAWYT